MAMGLQCIKNGKKRGQPKLDTDIVKIVVIGEPKVGKTSFIHQFYNRHEPGRVKSHNGVRWYPCESMVNGMHRRAAIFKIPGYPDFYREQRTPHYKDANAIVLMYAIDDPLSFELLTDKWLPEVSDIIGSKEIPMLLVGNKKDLRNNTQVIQRLALNDETPVTYEHAEYLLAYDEIKDIREISTRNVEEVEEAFNLVFSFAL